MANVDFVVGIFGPKYQLWHRIHCWFREILCETLKIYQTTCCVGRTWQVDLTAVFCLLKKCMCKCVTAVLSLFITVIIKMVRCEMMGEFQGWAGESYRQVTHWCPQNLQSSVCQPNQTTRLEPVFPRITHTQCREAVSCLHRLIHDDHVKLNLFWPICGSGKHRR